MFRSPNEIPPLIDLLATRQASLWHACQLADLRSYLRLGGIPSRQRLERERLAFTRFQSDTSDRARGVWDKVFLNLGDLGRPFAWGMRSTPNVYGPIAFQLAPKALSECSDVAVCLRSASSVGFDRDSEALTTPAEVSKVFVHPAAVGFPRSSFTRYGDSLREAFPCARRGPHARAQLHGAGRGQPRSRRPVLRAPGGHLGRPDHRRGHVAAGPRPSGSGGGWHQGSGPPAIDVRRAPPGPRRPRRNPLRQAAAPAAARRPRPRVAGHARLGPRAPRA